MTASRAATILAPLLAILAAAPARAEPRVTCHCTYGGETVDVAVAPTEDPYRVADVPVGRRFLFRAVWVQAPAAEAALTLSVHRATKDGPVPLAEVKFRPPWPVAAPDAPHGFTGLHRVYEPTLGAELAFWCAGTP